MPYYLLKIIKRKWDKLNLPWLEPDQIQADPLGDLRINEGELSLWYIDEDRSNLDLIITALAVNRESFDKLEYGLFDQRIVEEIGLKIQKTPGATPIDSANFWHYDLIHLTIEKASNLVKSIFGNLVKQRILADDLRDKVLKAIRDGNIDLQKLNKSMRSKINQLMR